ncbi:MAG: hypothetical protein AAFP19_03870 [Bacteroidota bacterium]
MKRTFKPLFQVHFQHAYFNKGNAANVFQLGPNILNGSPNIGIRQIEKGYMVYAQESLDAMILGFPIYFQDPNFLNYTDLDFTPAELFYFSSDQAVEGVLSSSPKLPLRPSRFAYPLTVEAQKQLTKLSLTGPNQQHTILTLPQAPYAPTYPIAINGELNGKYQLQMTFKEGSKNRDYFFFYSDQLYHHPSQAVFEWNGPSNATNDNIPTYTLAFKARSTYWRYIFLGLNEKDWEQVNISSIKVNDQMITFQKAKTVYTLSDGRPSYTALSSAPIPLRERPKWMIRLQSKKWPEGIILPYPQMSNLPILETKEGSSLYYSDIYCHLS